jgi:hypothetical protein
MGGRVERPRHRLSAAGGAPRIVRWNYRQRMSAEL